MEAGAEVVVGSSQTSRIEAAAMKLGQGATGHTVDVRDEASVSAFFDAVGAFDHLVFTAGDWGPYGSARSASSMSRRAKREWKCGFGARPEPPSTQSAKSQRTAQLL